MKQVPIYDCLKIADELTFTTWQTAKEINSKVRRMHLTTNQVQYRLDLLVFAGIAEDNTTPEQGTWGARHFRLIAHFGS